MLLRILRCLTNMSIAQVCTLLIMRHTCFDFCAHTAAIALRRRPRKRGHTGGGAAFCCCPSPLATPRTQLCAAGGPIYPATHARCCNLHFSYNINCSAATVEHLACGAKRRQAFRKLLCAAIHSTHTTHSGNPIVQANLIL